MEVGQKVYINTRHQFYSGEVVKVTPSGMTDVRFGPGNAVSRFGKDGRRRGDSYYNAWRLDTEMSFQERSNWLNDEQSRLAATVAIKNIGEPGRQLSTWGRTPEKQEMMEVLDGFQKQIDEARKLVDLCK